MTRKVLLLGADGFIGRHLALGLKQKGWQVLASARRTDRLSQMGFETLSADLGDPRCHRREFWQPHLADCTKVVNAAGLLSGSEKGFHAIHHAAPLAVYQAMPEGSGGILISAIGIDQADTPFARHRRTGETIASEFGLTILRPGLVLSDSSYGGSSMIRGLAAAPMFLALPGKGDQRFNPIHAADLADIVAACLDTPPSDTGPHDIGGPEHLSLRDILQKTRHWLGLPSVRFLPLPTCLTRLVARIGDMMRLGPISSTALKQLDAGVETGPVKLPDHLPGLERPPRGFSEFLYARPAGTQDLWQARLYLFKPVLRVALVLLWLFSGLLGLFLPPEQFLPLVEHSVLNPTSLIVLARLGALADLAIAFALFRGWRLRLMGWIQIGLVLGYTLSFTVLAPVLWLLPLGGLLKNPLILLLLVVFLILEEER